jgi:glutathione S-transferase
MALPILYSGTKNASSWAMRAWLALKEAAVPFEERVVDIRRPQRFANLAEIAAFSPSATVPVLVVDDQVIFDSIAIMEFASEIGGGRLLPSDPVRRAKARSVVAWQHSGLSNICARISFESAFYPYKRPLTDEEQAEAKLLFDHLEQLLETSGGPFLFGDMSLADCMLAPAVVRLIRHRADLTAHPASRVWSQALLSRETVVEWMSEADTLPHIWFDDYLLPGALPELFRDRDRAAIA